MGSQVAAYSKFYWQPRRGWYSVILTLSVNFARSCISKLRVNRENCWWVETMHWQQNMRSSRDRWRYLASSAGVSGRSIPSLRSKRFASINAGISWVFEFSPRAIWASAKKWARGEEEKERFPSPSPSPPPPPLAHFFCARPNSRAVKMGKLGEYPHLSTRNACFAGYSIPQQTRACHRLISISLFATLRNFKVITALSHASYNNEL